MGSTPAFINPSVLERLAQGSFAPTRKSADKTQTDRRNAFSPLTVTKRCIRYEPLVLTHRKLLILQMASALNDSKQKILLIGGPQGIGKTSLVRGLIELMGSRNQEPENEPQLLWFDINRHTDFEEIIQFLLQYILEVTATGPLSTDRRLDRNRNASDEDPMKRLETQLRQVQDMPLLLVLDNVEYIVDTSLKLNSYPFKELLNFLLGFPNIKMILIGERLPYADMSPNQDGVLDIQLDGLDKEDTLAFWQSRSPRNVSDPAVLERELSTDNSELLHQLYQKIQGSPWLVKVTDALRHHAHLDLDTLNRLLNENQKTDDPQTIAAVLVRLAYERLPDQHRRLFQTLSFLRHPVNAKALLALMNVCFPLLDANRPSADTITDLLEHSLIRPFLKISFPPQQVLHHIRNRHQSPETESKSTKYQPWFELYFSAKQALYQALPVDEQARIHDVLQDFYLRDKGREAEQRVLRIKNRALLAEARYHGSLSRNRSNDPGKEELSASFNSKAYVYQQDRPWGGPVSGQKLSKTLDDYRQIQLPEPAESSLETSFEPLTHSGPADDSTAIHVSTSHPTDLPPASFPDILASLDLNEDERHILSETRELVIQAPTTPVTPEPEIQPEEFTQFTGDNIETPHARATEEEERIIQKRLAAAVAGRDANRIARELLALAQYRASRGRYEEALHCLDKAAQMKAEPQPTLLAEIYQLYGSIYKETYQHNAALSALNKAAAQMQRVIEDDRTVSPLWMQRLGRVYQDLGEIQAYRKQAADAADSFIQALQWYQISGEETRLAEIHFQLAGIYEDMNQTPQAIAQYQQALTLDEQAENLPAMAAILANLGQLYQQTGQPELALQHLYRSLNCDQQLSDWDGQLRTLEVIAQIQQEAQSWLEAESTLKQGLSIAMRQRLSLWQATFYTHLGGLAMRQRHWEDALQAYEAARSAGEAELSNESLDWLNKMVAEVQALASGSV